MSIEILFAHIGEHGGMFEHKSEKWKDDKTYETHEEQISSISDFFGIV